MRLEGAAFRRGDMFPDILAGIERWTHVEMAACFGSHAGGRRSVFDSALVVCRTTGIGAQSPGPGETRAWEVYGRCEIELLRLSREGRALWV